MDGTVDARRRPLLGWDVGFAATVAAMAAIGLYTSLGEDPAGLAFGALLRILWPLLVLTAWYPALGRAAILRGIREERMHRRDLVFLCGLVVLVGLATAVVTSYATLQAIAYPIVWTIVARYRDAVLWSAALALAVGAGLLTTFVRADAPDGYVAVAAIVLLSFVFAVVMGTWITRVFAQGERYRYLLEELRASQGEVAALSQAAGASAERERMSRDLHDTLTQTLTGLVMLSEQAGRALDAGDDARARDRIGRTCEAAREAVSEARALVATTQPLGDGGLEAAVARIAARLRADAGLEVSCALAPLELDRERQVVLLRAVQEGLANARRHARAARVRVELRAMAAGGALLRIDDDGVGPGAAESGGFGLSGLGDRVRAVGGSVIFGPGPERGSRLEVRLEAVPGAPAGDPAVRRSAAGSRGVAVGGAPRAASDGPRPAGDAEATA
ncbi:histidine kinase [Leucobacter allii]|uniref:sensor histidine kinase n=1 Tax=Leucobacter allii TaxID=2932247 RepID=UPI001FD467EB|nr:histidine kinase [Leucobacter allii]UOR01738.1 histidine kinase [Leucobacter allii]